MCNYTNENRSVIFDCQCPYRDACQRYGYRESYNQGQRSNQRNCESREYRGRSCSSCSLCNIFRRNHN